MDVKELKIPVPWGHIAAKTWGREENQAVLVFHGINNNAGSFDRLIIFLPTCYYYICVDFPSHGRSSPYPPHKMINAIDNVLCIKLLVEHFRRDKYIFMGHSWGAQAITLYTQLYPQHALKLILLDSFCFYPTLASNFQETLKQNFSKLKKLDENSVNRKLPVYSYIGAVETIIKKPTYGKLTWEAAIPIIERMLVPVEGKTNRFTLNIDPRVKFATNMFFGFEILSGICETYKITCPVLLLITSEMEPFFGFISDILEKTKSCNPNFVIVKLKGDHNIHNNLPNLTASIINKFLLNEKSKL